MPFVEVALRGWCWAFWKRSDARWGNRGHFVVVVVVSSFLRVRLGENDVVVGLVNDVGSGVSSQAMGFGHGEGAFARSIILVVLQEEAPSVVVRDELVAVIGFLEIELLQFDDDCGFKSFRVVLTGSDNHISCTSKPVIASAECLVE